MAVLCALGCGGCDVLFRIDQVPAGPDDGRRDTVTADTPTEIDATLDAAGRGLCPGGAPTFLETFNAATVSNVCKPWGSAYADTGVTVTQSGTLAITANPTGAAVGGCTMNSATSLGTSVTVVVNSVVTGGGAYNVFEIHTIDYQIKQAGGLLRFQDAASTDHGIVTYDTSMKYWRMRLDGPTTLFGEYSTDGVTFSQLGLVTIPSTTTGTIELSVGTTTSGGTGSGQFDELFICP